MSADSNRSPRLGQSSANLVGFAYRKCTRVVVGDVCAEAKQLDVAANARMAAGSAGVSARADAGAKVAGEKKTEVAKQPSQAEGPLPMPEACGKSGGRRSREAGNLSCRAPCVTCLWGCAVMREKQARCVSRLRVQPRVLSRPSGFVSR